MTTRRRLLAGIGAGLLAAGVVVLRGWPAAGAAAPAPVLGETALGSPDAPVTVVEYFSLTCSHCRDFHVQVLPAFKRRFIDTGKVRLVMRPFPRDRADLSAQILARCAGKDRFFVFIDVLFHEFDRWTRAADPREALAKIGLIGGISRDAFDACLANRKLKDAVAGSLLEAQRDYGVDSTPTFIIGGRKYVGVLGIERLAAIIAPLLAGS